MPRDLLLHWFCTWTPAPHDSQWFPYGAPQTEPSDDLASHHLGNPCRSLAVASLSRHCNEMTYDKIVLTIPCSSLAAGANLVLCYIEIQPQGPGSSGPLALPSLDPDVVCSSVGISAANDLSTGDTAWLQGPSGALECSMLSLIWPSQACEPCLYSQLVDLSEHPHPHFLVTPC